jgi:hypothetical protein
MRIPRLHAAFQTHISKAQLTTSLREAGSRERQLDAPPFFRPPCLANRTFERGPKSPKSNSSFREDQCCTALRTAFSKIREASASNRRTGVRASFAPLETLDHQILRLLIACCAGGVPCAQPLKSSLPPGSFSGSAGCSSTSRLDGSNRRLLLAGVAGHTNGLCSEQISLPFQCVEAFLATCGEDELAPSPETNSIVSAHACWR